MVRPAQGCKSWPRNTARRCSWSTTTHCASNYAEFRKHLPRVQAYYAVKANSDPAIVQTLYEAGASFDVASLAEFQLVHENIKSLPAKQRQDFIWDKIIYANPIKDNRTLIELDPYKPLVTYDNSRRDRKIKKHAPRCRADPAAARAQHRRGGRAFVEVRRGVPAKRSI